MKKLLQSWIEALWYKDQVISTWLMPLSMLFLDVVRMRRFFYKIGIFKRTRLPVPVIIVGNITVGGTGKTPLVIYLAQLLQKTGYQPGIISRGYGGKARKTPQLVTPDSQAAEVGDEALVISRNSLCPVVVGPKRVESARQLIEQQGCNVILSDDGLQHYALERTIEITVVDGQRRFGNGYCLPVGPLREPISRIQEVDFIVVNGEPSEANEYAMNISADQAVNLSSNERQPLSAFVAEPIHAVAGIGNPERFFNLLKSFELKPITHQFPDHYAYSLADLDFKDSRPILMTEKDAVKCQAFADAKFWYVPINSVLNKNFDDAFLALLKQRDTTR